MSKKKPTFFQETALTVPSTDKEPWPAAPSPILDMLLEMKLQGASPDVIAKALGRKTGAGINVKVGKLVTRRYDEQPLWYVPGKNRTDRCGVRWWGFEIMHLKEALHGWQRREQYPQETDMEVCEYVARCLGRSSGEVVAKAQERRWVR